MSELHVRCSIVKLEDVLAAEDLGDQYSATLEHIAECPLCQQRIRDLAGDSRDWNLAAEVIALPNCATEQVPHDLKGLAGWSEESMRQLLAPPSHPELLGRVGRYDIERLVGSGGMGVVFKAHDVELNRPVAIKLLAPNFVMNSKARNRFAREARSAAGVVDDHVVPIFNVGSDHDTPYLVMQFVGGGSLQDKLDRDGPLSAEDVVRIGMQVAKGLAAAHAQGLIHRDVKPSNILLDEVVERALLTDFGLARAKSDVELTLSGFHPGTPNYMSPEQVRGEELDCRSDLFGLGCVMYSLIVGHPPFRADSNFAVLRRVTDDPPHSMRRPNTVIQPWLEAIILKLLEKPMAKRYQSAGEVAALLTQCLAHLQQPGRAQLPASLRSKESFPYFKFLQTTKGVVFMLSLVVLVCSLATIGNVGLTGASRLLLFLQTSGSQQNTRQLAKDDPKSTEQEKATDAKAPKGGRDLEGRRDFAVLAQKLDRSFGEISTESGVKVTWTGADFANQLLQFEEDNRGAYIGLLALRKLTDATGKKQVPFGVAVDGERSIRSQAMERFVYYAESPLLASILYNSMFHRSLRLSDRTTENSLRAVINSPNALPSVRQTAELCLSLWMLRFKRVVQNPEQVEAGLLSLAKGNERLGEAFMLQHENQKAIAPDEMTYLEWENEAVAILNRLKNKANNSYVPTVVEFGDPNIVTIKEGIDKNSNSISQLASLILEELSSSAGVSAGPFPRKFRRAGLKAPETKSSTENGT
ncbi:MAG: serine/threonine-protein kinase [Planctomycetota bacterium]